MRDERRPGLDGPGRMVKSRGLDGKISYLTKIWVFSQKVYKLVLFEILVEVSLLSPWRSPCRRGTRVIISTLGVSNGAKQREAAPQSAKAFCATPHTDANSIQKDNHQLSTQFKKTKRGPAFRAK